MRTEKSNKLRKSYIMGLIGTMIILQIILIYCILSDIEYGDINVSTNEMVVEETESSSMQYNDLLSHENRVEVEFGKITLVGILMIGTGYLFFIKEGFNISNSEGNNYMTITEDNKIESKN